MLVAFFPTPMNEKYAQVKWDHVPKDQGKIHYLRIMESQVTGGLEIQKNPATYRFKPLSSRRVQ